MRRVADVKTKLLRAALGHKKSSTSGRCRAAILAPVGVERDSIRCIVLAHLSPVYAAWMNNAEVDDGLFTHGSP